MKATKGLVLVNMSGQNIDRLVAVFRATRKAPRNFILDGYTAHICRATGNPNIPQPDWKGVRVYWPQNLRVRLKRKKRFDLIDGLPGSRIFPEALPTVAAQWVMTFRQTMIPDLERQETCLKDASLIYSLWSGYLEDKSTKDMRDWLVKHRIPLYKIHTSGHASPMDLKRLVAAIAPKVVVPVHSYAPRR